MKGRTYSQRQISELKTHLEDSFGSGRLMNRNGGQLAVECFNSECRSKKTPGKKKLEFALQTGVYSCWTCGIKGLLRPESKILKGLSKRNSKIINLQNWIKNNFLFDQNKIPQELIEGEKWSQGILSFLFNEFNEEGDVEAEEIPIEELAIHRLALARKGSPVWDDWNERWKSYRGSQIDSISAAWALDIRYCPYKDWYEYQIPGWSSDGRLLGIHLWRPKEYIKYLHVGEKTNFLLGENLINWKEPVYLVEGLWDLIIGGSNAICLLGSTLPEKSRIKSLLLENSPDIFVCLDQDAQDKAWKIAEELSRCGLSVQILKPPQKDPGDCEMPIIEWKRSVPSKRWTWENSIIEELGL